MKDKVKIRYVFIGLAFVAVVGWWLHSQSVDACNTLDGTGLGGKQGRSTTDSPSPLPTIKEIQERIGAEPDGILGPETQRLWDLAICNQYGVYECQKAGM